MNLQKIILQTLVFLALTQCKSLSGTEQLIPTVFEFEAVRTIYDTIQYKGIEKRGTDHHVIMFELLNPRNSSICVKNNGHDNYFGEIDYFSEKGDSYKLNTSTEINVLGALNSDTGISKYDTYTVVMKGQTLIIEREISLGLLPDGNQMFMNNGPFYAELRLAHIFECSAKDATISMTSAKRTKALLQGNFVFLSGRIGPFYLE